MQVNTSARCPSHQLSNGLYVSGHPDRHRERGPTIAVPQMPYTGGDVKKSGELGRMFDIQLEEPSPEKSEYIKPSKSPSFLYGSSSSSSGPLSGGGNTRSSLLATGISSFSPTTQKLKSGFHGSKSGPLVGCNVNGKRQVSNSGPLVVGTTGVSAGVKLVNTDSKLPTVSDGSLPVTSTPSSKKSGLLSPTLPATGLITSSSVSFNSSTSSVTTVMSPSGPIDGTTGPVKSSTGGGGLQPINHLVQEEGILFKRDLPRIVFLVLIPLFIMGFIAGGFIIATVQNSALLIAVGALFTVVLLLLVWNFCLATRPAHEFLRKFPESELAAAKDGQYVKVTGYYPAGKLDSEFLNVAKRRSRTSEVVTCGSATLESSYERVTRCMYTSTGLYQYVSLKSLFLQPARNKHQLFTWRQRQLERKVVDFYISDSRSGVRALVKAGYSARVTPYVEEAVIVNISPKVENLPSEYMRWIRERALPTEGPSLQLREGYVKEGSVVTVLGVLRRHENMLLIMPPSDVKSTGCLWRRLLLPTKLEGIILVCDKSSLNNGIPV